MKVICVCLALLQLFPSLAWGKSPIAFVAQVSSDALAEEAILLLHCLASRSDTAWEFSGEASGSHWLKVAEKGGKLLGTYRREAATREFLLEAGGSEETCDKLEPPAPGTVPLEAGPSFQPALATAEDAPASAPAGRAWIWVGLGVAAVAGFFYWKSRQPQHRGAELHD